MRVQFKPRTPNDSSNTAVIVGGECMMQSLNRQHQDLCWLTPCTHPGTRILAIAHRTSSITHIKGRVSVISAGPGPSNGQYHSVGTHVGLWLFVTPLLGCSASHWLASDHFRIWGALARHPTRWSHSVWKHDPMHVARLGLVDSIGHHASHVSLHWVPAHCVGRASRVLMSSVHTSIVHMSPRAHEVKPPWHARHMPS